MDISPDGKKLAVLGLGNIYNDVGVAFYDAATGNPGVQLPVITEHPLLAMTWSSDGRRLALESAKQLTTEVTIWDTETGRLLVTLNRPDLTRGKRRAFRFSPDGNRLLHISADNRVEYGAYNNPSTHPIQIWDATPMSGDTGNERPQNVGSL